MGDKNIQPLKSPGLAAVLSFFVPGLGQIYNGEIGKGIAFVFLYILCWALVSLLIGIPLLLVLWIFAITDAYKTAERINAKRG